MKGVSLAPLCFFLISVSYKLAWTAISSLLSQYSKTYGPGILLQLNVAYFFPSIPVLMLQTAFNDRMDKRLGVPMGALLRYGVGLGGLVALTRYFQALTAGSERALLGTTVLVGMSYGVAFGTSYQMASKYPAGATVALTTGFVSSGPVVLLLDLALKRGPFYTEQGLADLFGWVSVVTAAGLVAAAALVLGSWRMLSAAAPHRVELKVPYKSSSFGSGNGGLSNGYGKDVGAAAVVHGTDHGRPYHRHRADAAGYGGSMAAPTANGYSQAGGVHSGGGGHGHGHHAITFDFEHGVGHGGDGYGYGQGKEAYGGGRAAGGGGRPGWETSVAVSADDSKVSKRDLPLARLALRIAPAALSIAISVGTSMLVFPFFTYMRSTGLLGVRLPQVLFYIRLSGDILGRMVPRRLQTTSIRGLLLWAVVKLAMVPLLFACVFRPELTGGDAGAAAAVGAFWLLSGYLNTCSYLAAPGLVPPGQKARASGLMTVAFQSSCFAALLAAYGIQRLSLPQGLGAILSHDHGTAAAAVAAGVHH